MRMPKALSDIDFERGKLLTKKHAPGIIANMFRYIFFLSISYVIVYPFLFMLLNSIMGINDSYDVTVTWVPKSPTLEHFKNAWIVYDVGDSLVNTFVYEIVTALIQFMTCAIAAYGMARFKIKGRGLLSALMILNILVPSMMIIIPTYVQFSHLDFLGIFGAIGDLIGTDLQPNITNSPWAFYLPGLLGVGLKGGLFIYIYMQFFKGLPKELEEAAWIDGAGPWKTFLTIVLPSSGSAMITVLLFSVIWHWNDLFLANMYTEETTFAVALSTFGGNSLVNKLNISIGEASLLQVPVLLSGCLIFVLPLIIFYILIQRKFVASIATSGIVG
ncbi:MAG: carbohydrate ABC transporter permease [Ruminococcaceae bacterium]|nr:carbohydrate ABC transporter permease [Oscillospiraceae bacterium]